jgi:site-specific DNA-methyltransferase (adenine-specific)
MEIKNIVFNIDCIKGMLNYPDKNFDLAIVDPPYGIGINISIGRRKGDKKSNYHKFAGLDLSIPDKIYFDELFRVSKNQIIWGGNYMIQFLYSSPCWLLWDKGFSENVSFGQFELAWTSFNSTTKKYNKSSNQINRIHPTQKPIELYKWILDKYAKTGDKILDTHVGSGSSRIAAHDYGFDFTGYELDYDYFNAQEKRFKNHCLQLKLF